MQKRSLALIVGGAAISMAAASVTQGAVTITATNTGPAKNQSGSIAAVGHSGWLLTLTAAEGQVITGIDVGGNPQDPTAPEGIRGVLGQRWNQAVDDEGNVVRTPTAADPDKNNTSTDSLDSHFLVTANKVDVFPFSEDNDGAAQAGFPVDTASSDYGKGGLMQGVIGLLPTGQARTVELAYVVLADTGQGRAILNVSTAVDESALDITFGIPEPTTLSLVGLAGLGMMARRRKI